MGPTAAISLTIFAVISIYKLINLCRYVRLAQRTGLPYVFTPALETEVWGYILTPIFRKLYHGYLLQGEGWPRWCRFMIKDWAFEDKHRAHSEFGEVFLVVSPEGIICYSADATTNYDVMMRKNEFVKPHDKYKLLEPYGPNVNTAEGKTYQFHLRITAPPFNDLSGVNDLVWRETISQTKLLMKSWSEQLSQTLQLDVAGVTLAVISLAGFGKRLEWSSNSIDPKNNVPPGYKLSFLRAMTGTTTNLVAILLLPAWLLNLTPLREAALAYSQLEKYMRDMIRSEKHNLAEKKDHESEIARGNLLTSLLRVSASEGNDESSESRKKAFSEDEVIGNLFIFLIAGYETTSNVILYGLIILAIQPEIQNRILAEVDRAYTDVANEGRDELSYADDFEKFDYTYGFMYEMFRQFPGVTHITKMVHSPTNIIVSPPGAPSPSHHMLPADCRVYLSCPGTNYSPRYWPSPLKVDPQRWDGERVANGNSLDTAGPAMKKVTTADRARQMRGTFLTFSDGQRSCLGRKFAQSEYIAFLATLLKDYRVVLGEGQDFERVEKDVYLRCAGRITLAPLDNVKLELKRRLR